MFWSSLEHTAFFALLAGPGLIIVGLALADAQTRLEEFDLFQ